MIDRTLFNGEHCLFRDNLKRFLTREVLPFHSQWEERGYVSREIWNRAGSEGFLCPTVPEEYGGSGGDQLFSISVIEEIAIAGASGLGWSLHSDVVAPYILSYGTETQMKHYLPKMVKGEIVGAIAITEPVAGSDLKSILTTAKRVGDEYVVSGSKTFITNGLHCDLVILAVKTDSQDGAKGISLLLVDATLPGFSRGKLLKKSGMHALDTTELFFQDMRVPVSNLLGNEGQGFALLMQQLPWERLQAAIHSIASAEAALSLTIEYTKERHAFGREFLAFQNTRFTLSELKTEVQIGRVFVDKCAELLLQGKLDTTVASMAKYWSTNLRFKVTDACVQLFGG
ncbi:MAG TPA: acyl-CoA dehydrogenase family protein, partial [Bellilinea sp.]|nr:acyl-CoA dehydrogenase family protein [Bellilinea sp.]